MTEAMTNMDNMKFVDEGMSNFEHTIDDNLAQILRDGEDKLFAQHSAWDFCGYVWYSNGIYHEQIWRYKSPIDEIEAETLEDLMEEANSRYGYN